MKKAIYVIEDDADIGELIAFLLAEQGFEVTVFSSISSFRYGNGRPLPALLMVDVMLPDGNGLDICQQWKTNHETKHIPVLLMSAYEDNRSDGRACRADGFISKPFDITELLGEVKQHVG